MTTDITNGYDTQALYKIYASIDSTEQDDLDLIDATIESASRFIDAQSGRTFYARTETRYYDVPSGRQLDVDDDLLTITTLTNGDGNTIAATEYNFVPRNVSPKFAIKLKSTSTYSWQSATDGGSEYVISIAGTWGWVADTPDDIREACRLITKDYLAKRSGQGVGGVATITGAGVVISPSGIPASAMQIINRYRKRT